MNINRLGYIQNAEVICIFSLRLHAGLCDDIDLLSRVEAGAMTELSN